MKMRLTKKEKEAVGVVVGEGLDQSTYNLLGQLNFEGGYRFVEEYTYEELHRVILWIWNKLGV
jgi:hypothetical protein